MTQNIPAALLKRDGQLLVRKTFDTPSPAGLGISIATSVKEGVRVSMALVQIWPAPR